MDVMLNGKKTQTLAKDLRQTANKQFEKQRAWSASEA